jgi:hypothetical protein
MATALPATPPGSQQRNVNDRWTQSPRRGATASVSWVEIEFDEPRMDGKVRPGALHRTTASTGQPSAGGHGGTNPAAWHAHLPRQAGPSKAPRPIGKGPAMTNEKHYQTAAGWAEHDMRLKPSSTTALRGEVRQRMAKPHRCGSKAADPGSTQPQSMRSTPARDRSAYLTTSTPNSTKSPPNRTVDPAKSCAQPSLSTSSPSPVAARSPSDVDSRR